jgi:hypothetical protein
MGKNITIYIDDNTFLELNKIKDISKSAIFRVGVSTILFNNKIENKNIDITLKSEIINKLNIIIDKLK